MPRKSSKIRMLNQTFKNFAEVTKKARKLKYQSQRLIRSWHTNEQCGSRSSSGSLEKATLWSSPALFSSPRMNSINISTYGLMNTEPPWEMESPWSCQSVPRENVTSYIKQVRECDVWCYLYSTSCNFKMKMRVWKICKSCLSNYLLFHDLIQSCGHQTEKKRSFEDLSE